jgi:hypothetical protein
MRRALAAALATVIALLPAAASASAADGVDFGVSVSADPVRAQPGTVAETWIAVSNRSDRPVELEIRNVTLFPSKDGTFEVIDEPDATWAAALDHDRRVALAPREYLRVPVTVNVPAVDPNLYIVGFLVETVIDPQPGAVTVRSRITSHIVLDVPGPRTTSVSAPWHRVPRLTIGRSVTGMVRVSNDGAATVQIRAQVRMDRSWRATNAGVIQATGERPQLLPAEAAKTISYGWRAGGPWFMGRPNIELSYAEGGPTLSSSRIPGPLVLVLPIETLLVLTAMGLLVVGIPLRRRRKRRATSFAERSRR